MAARLEADRASSNLTNMSPRRLLLLCVTAVTFLACRQRPVVQPTPVRRMASQAELAIYRLLAESTYVRSTGRPVAVVSLSLDSSCVATECAPLARRWGVESPWWAAVADTQRARSANSALLRHAGDVVDLHAVGEGHTQIVPIETREIPNAGSDAGMWGEFQFYHRGAAGLLRFSPVGFSPSGHEAVVFARWDCGPECGHTVVTALRADSSAAWHIADMLLLSSRKPINTIGN
jgi:hypothetical protein